MLHTQHKLKLSENALRILKKRYLKKELSKEQQRSDWGGELSQEQLEYAANDVAALMELDPILEQCCSSRVDLLQSLGAFYSHPFFNHAFDSIVEDALSSDDVDFPSHAVLSDNVRHSFLK